MCDAFGRGACRFRSRVCGDVIVWFFKGAGGLVFWSHLNVGEITFGVGNLRALVLIIFLPDFPNISSNSKEGLNSIATSTWYLCIVALK